MMRFTGRQGLKLGTILASAFPVEISLFLGFFGWLEVFHYLRQWPGLDGPLPQSKVLIVVELLFLATPWVLFFVFLRQERQSKQVRLVFAVPCLLGCFFGILCISSLFFFTFAVGGMLAAVALFTLVALTFGQAIVVLRGVFRGMRGLGKG